MPSSELVEAYMSEIAKAYKVDWESPMNDKAQAFSEEKDETVRCTIHTCTSTLPILEQKGKGKIESEPGKVEENGSATTVNAASALTGSGQGKISPPPIAKEPPEDDLEALARRFQALKKR